MGGLSRRQREKRAYSLTLVSGGGALLAIVLLVLAVFGVVGIGPALIVGVIATVAAFLLRNTLKK